MRTMISVRPNVEGVDVMLAPTIGGSGEETTISIDTARSLAAMLMRAADEAEAMTRRVRAEDVAAV